MSTVTPAELVEVFIDGFQQSGGAPYYISDSVTGHPRKFVVESSGSAVDIWIYAWNLTHGGRTSLPDEYRIQMTSVESPLDLNPNGHTVLMGYYSDLRVFAGFDLSKHRNFTVGSPSIQINIDAIHQALQKGLSFHSKSNDEIAVGVRPDQLLNYILSSDPLHKYGSEEAVRISLNTEISSTGEVEKLTELVGTERQRIVQEVSRYNRNGNFRKAVLNAYDNRCAVTRMQMRLVDAAHIVPVRAEGGSDHVSNGVCLSPTIHRAYDNCLIYLDRDLTMRLNEEKASQLKNDGIDGGIDGFRALLDKPVHLPLDIDQRPKVEFIERANLYRRIPGYS